MQINNTKVKVDKAQVNNNVQVNNTKVKVDKSKVNNTEAQVDNTKAQVNNDNVHVNNNKVHVNKNNTKDKLIIIKKDKIVDQVNLIAKRRADYLKISETMNDLHDDPRLRYIELDKINTLTDKLLDHAWELSHGNREWYVVINNIDTINDKIDLVNEICEAIDSYRADAYNIVDGINKSHNNDPLYDILAEDLEKCKDEILKLLNSFNVHPKNDKHIDRLSKINLLQDRKIFNHMRMILKKFLYEQITCDKFITTESNKHVTILQSHNQSIKNVKVTLREGEALICVKKLSKNIKRCPEIIITNHEVLLILSEIDNRKRTKKKAYISICGNKIISYTLTIFIREKNFIEYTNDKMRYIGMNTLIKMKLFIASVKYVKN